ncbi:MAG TPA: cytochrome b/b6 domain-containing protein [Oscillospiraceae bacterium]|nr:cytochrome b/b6 domain-containing protein [Oscillospiraceae bacterium]
MTKNQTFKILIDISMTSLFIILLKAFDTGLEFHEIAGLGIFVLIAVHNIMNISWIKNVAKNIFSDKIKLKTKLMFGLNMLLTLFILTIVITGILISKVLFTFISVGAQEQLIFIHKISSYICLGIIGAHILVHAKYLVAMFKKLLLNIKSRSVLVPLSGFALTVLVVTVTARQLYLGTVEISADNITANPDSEYSYSAVSEETTSIPQVKFIETTEIPETTIVPQITEAPKITAAPENTTVYNCVSESTSDTVPSKITESTQIKAVSETTIQTTQTSAEPEISLEDYLGKLFCTACPKHCPLSNPRCGRGEVQAEQATAEYSSIYGQG